MQVFVTGASGFIGSAVVDELIGAGYTVLGLVRSEESANLLSAKGADTLRGELTDLDSLKKGASESDAVIHCAFIHDFSKFQENCAIDKLAIETMGSVLEGSSRPLIATHGVAMLAPGRVATEDDSSPAVSASYPRASEATANMLAARGVNASTIRLAPSVHGKGDKGFVPMLIEIARQKGVSAYIGEGANRWPGVHRLDAAKLYRLVIEKGIAGKSYHGIADEGVPTKEIAEVIGRQLNLPVVSKTQEEAMEHFGFLGMFFGLDCAASSELTQQQLGWTPVQPGLISDVEANYFG